MKRQKTTRIAIMAVAIMFILTGYSGATSTSDLLKQAKAKINQGAGDTPPGKTPPPVLADPATKTPPKLNGQIRTLADGVPKYLYRDGKYYKALRGSYLDCNRILHAATGNTVAGEPIVEDTGILVNPQGYMFATFQTDAKGAPVWEPIKEDVDDSGNKVQISLDISTVTTWETAGKCKVTPEPDAPALAKKKDKKTFAPGYGAILKSLGINPEDYPQVTGVKEATSIIASKIPAKVAERQQLQKMITPMQSAILSRTLDWNGGKSSVKRNIIGAALIEWGFNDDDVAKTLIDLENPVVLQHMSFHDWLKDEGWLKNETRGEYAAKNGYKTEAEKVGSFVVTFGDEYPGGYQFTTWDNTSEIIRLDWGQVDKITSQFQGMYQGKQVTGVLREAVDPFSGIARMYGTMYYTPDRPLIVNFKTDTNVTSPRLNFGDKGQNALQTPDFSGSEIFNRFQKKQEEAEANTAEALTQAQEEAATAKLALRTAQGKTQVAQAKLNKTLDALKQAQTLAKKSQANVNALAQKLNNARNSKESTQAQIDALAQELADANVANAMANAKLNRVRETVKKDKFLGVSKTELQRALGDNSH